MAKAAFWHNIDAEGRKRGLKKHYNVTMQTRHLIIASLITGLFILVAFGVWLYTF